MERLPVRRITSSAAPGVISMSISLYGILFWRRKRLATRQSGHQKAEYKMSSIGTGWIPNELIGYGFQEQSSNPDLKEFVLRTSGGFFSRGVWPTIRGVCCSPSGRSPAHRREDYVPECPPVPQRPQAPKQVPTWRMQVASRPEAARRQRAPCRRRARACVPPIWRWEY